MIRITALPLAAIMLAAAGVAYAQADTQADTRPARGGNITQEQVVAMADRMFDRLDLNQDGTIDAADRALREQAAFERLDADGDGVVTLAEFQAAREARGERLAERGERGQARREGARAEGPRGPGPRGPATRHFAQFPGNAEGTVTREEFRANALARFERLDADGDGVITPEERRAARGKRDRTATS